MLDFWWLMCVCVFVCVCQVIRYRNELMHSCELHMKDEWMRLFRATLKKLVRQFSHVSHMATAGQQIEQVSMFICGCVSSLLNRIYVSLTCVLSLHLGPPRCGCMERSKETKVRREEMRKDVFREMRHPFLCGVTWSDIPLWWGRHSWICCRKRQCFPTTAVFCVFSYSSQMIWK